MFVIDVIVVKFAKYLYGFTPKLDLLSYFVIESLVWAPASSTKLFITWSYLLVYARFLPRIM